MANYIAWYGKKRERLAKRELKFTKLLQNETDPARLAEGAEGIRAAQIRVLKARRAQLRPREDCAVAFKNLDAKTQYWLSLSNQEIIDGYRTGEFKVHATIERRRR